MGALDQLRFELLYAVKLYSHYLQFYSPYIYVLKNCQELDISPWLHFVFHSPLFHPVVLISHDYHTSQPNLANSSLPCVISHCICCSEFLSFHPIPPIFLYWKHLNITCCSVWGASHNSSVCGWCLATPGTEMRSNSERQQRCNRAWREVHL